MERLLSTFETPFKDRDGETYDIHLYGRSRPADTWQGWLVFTRRSDGKSFPTDVETTQPSAEAVGYWATGLTDTYFDGAFERARKLVAVAPPPARPVPPPLRDVTADRMTYLERLTELEREILAVFTRHVSTRLPAQTLMDELPHAHADTVRALEDLQKQGQYLIRTTDGGTDWVVLTDAGRRAAHIGVAPPELRV